MDFETDTIYSSSDEFNSHFSTLFLIFLLYIGAENTYNYFDNFFRDLLDACYSYSVILYDCMENQI